MSFRLRYAIVENMERPAPVIVKVIISR